MAKHLELTPRLQLLADWVPQGARLADVGTDHAYLPVWLSLHGRVSCAIASDLRKGPLERARLTGKTYGAENIDYRLCNGLVDIRGEEVDTVAIAGMGGETIASILADAPWTKDGQHTLLLQPMTRSSQLRQFLRKSDIKTRTGGETSSGSAQIRSEASRRLERRKNFGCMAYRACGICQRLPREPRIGRKSVNRSYACCHQSRKRNICPNNRFGRNYKRRR